MSSSEFTLAQVLEAVNQLLPTVKVYRPEDPDFPGIQRQSPQLLQEAISQTSTRDFKMLGVTAVVVPRNGVQFIRYTYDRLLEVALNVLLGRHEAAAALGAININLDSYKLGSSPLLRRCYGLVAVYDSENMLDAAFDNGNEVDFYLVLLSPARIEFGCGLRTDMQPVAFLGLGKLARARGNIWVAFSQAPMTQVEFATAVLLNLVLRQLYLDGSSWLISLLSSTFTTSQPINFK
ncbi:hypothetical protein HYR54_03535 [Candidatus Acetothermia bacterium]|nr:hypothetical protein [Candidatus Acetothermia bacterium]